MSKKATKKARYKDNYRFIDSSELNNATYQDYLSRFKRVAISIFEWDNLPSSMDGFELEKDLYYGGMASILFDENLGIINTRCTSNGYVNIYHKPTKLNCYSVGYNSYRNLYTGLKNENETKNSCILVENTIEREPTCGTMELFAYRLMHAEQTAFINIIAQRTPVLVVGDERQRVFLENLYSQYEGYSPVIFGDKFQLSPNSIQALKTDAPFIADKIMQYKKEIWNEALTFLGVNNINVDKKERLITDEANSNNELINLNLQNFLAPRKKACQEFNELFGFTGTDKEISVKVRSDLHNIIKTQMSVTTPFEKMLQNEIQEGGN